MKKLIFTCLAMLFLSFTFIVNGKVMAEERKFVIITDLEPDDRVALHLAATHIPKDNILFMGTTVMHAGRKKVLTRRLLDQLGLHNVPLYQGTGGTEIDDVDIIPLRAARQYAQEGKTILSKEDLEEATAQPISSDDLKNHIKEALEKDTNIEFILLAPATDLVSVLTEYPNLQKNVGHIHVMGGWSKDASDCPLRTSYNWTLSPYASKKLMEMSDIPMTLYTSEFYKSNFSGGSINLKNHPRIIEKMNLLSDRVPSLEDQKKAQLSWNKHVMEKIPALREVVAPYVEHQFTPADPLVVVGATNLDFIKRSRPVRVSIDLNDVDPNRGYRVEVTEDSASKIMLVDEVDTHLFEEELLKSFDKLAS